MGDKIRFSQNLYSILERLRASGSSRDSDRNKEASNPFGHTGHGNPAFTPQKAGKNAALVREFDFDGIMWPVAEAYINRLIFVG